MPNQRSNEPLAEHLTKPSKLGQEIAITGKWVTKNPSLDILEDARSRPGVLSTEINKAVGQDAILVHQVLASPEALVDYFAASAVERDRSPDRSATPQLHLVRGLNFPPEARALLEDDTNASYGEYLFGYVKDDYKRPDPEKAIHVTAKWTCKPGGEGLNEELKYWWQRVGTDAYSMEKGLIRYEVYQVVGEDALIIHEVFKDTAELKFHLSKGTAAKYKKDIDKIAAPECYYFRGPVSLTIRLYSKFLRLPATYSRMVSLYTVPEGTMSEGLI